MKKIISLSFVVLMLASVALFATSCANKDIEYGESKYVYEYKTDEAGVTTDHVSYFAFRKDGTGVYNYSHTYTNGGKKIQTAGVVYFDWKESTNGEIFLFETGSEYYNYSNSGQKIVLPTAGLTFGEGFLSFSENGTTYRYLLQK